MVKSNAVPKFLLATDASLVLTAPRLVTQAVSIEVGPIQVDFADISMRGQVDECFRFTLNFGSSIEDS